MRPLFLLYTTCQRKQDVDSTVGGLMQNYHFIIFERFATDQARTCQDTSYESYTKTLVSVVGVYSEVRIIYT